MNPILAPDGLDSTARYRLVKALMGQRIEFVRFGAPPVDGRSRNWITGDAEVGVSVYLIGHVPGRAGEYADRTLYMGTGILLDTGSDDEPVVRILTCKRAPQS